MKRSTLGGLLAATALALLAVLTVGVSRVVGATAMGIVINDRLDTTYRWDKHMSNPVQAAVDAASPGDTLWVRNECPGPIEISKSLTLTGQPLPGFYRPPEIDASSSGQSVVHVSGSDVQVQINSLLLNGGGNPRFPVEYGGGIYNDHATVTLDGVTITGNAAEHGGGIYNDHGTLTINNSTIDTNYGPLTLGLGAGIATAGGTLTVNASKITNNQLARFGGGIYAYGGGATVVVNASEIAYNQSEERPTLRADDGGGIYLYANPEDPWYTLILTDTKVHDHAVKMRGGGIYAYRANVTITGTSELSANRAVNGGGAYIGGTLLVSGDARIHGNTAEYPSGVSYGGGVRFTAFPYNAAGTFTMSGNAKIYGNSAGTSGGGIATYYAMNLSGCIPGAEEDGANVFDNTPNDIAPWP